VFSITYAIGIFASVVSNTFISVVNNKHFREIKQTYNNIGAPMIIVIGKVIGMETKWKIWVYIGVVLALVELSEV
jgi:hypothetical protein